MSAMLSVVKELYITTGSMDGATVGTKLYSVGFMVGVASVGTWTGAATGV